MGLGSGVGVLGKFKSPPASPRSTSPVPERRKQVRFVEPEPAPEEAEIRYVPTALFTNTLSVANALHKDATIEFESEELWQLDVVALLDTGAMVDICTKELADRIIQEGLAQPIRLREPIKLGALGTDYAALVTEKLVLPHRIGDKFSEHDFCIVDTPAPPHLILGGPWLEKHCPEALEILRRYGQDSPIFQASPPDASFPKPLRVTVTRNLNPKNPNNPANPNPIALPPSQDPFAAFSAGGVFAAIEAEEQRRKTCQEKFATALTVRHAIDHALEYHRQAQVLSAGVRGLTGNEEGWLETIPVLFRHFADTVFSDASAAKLPPLRPGHDCEIRLKKGAKLKAAKIYDMSQEQLAVLKQLLDVELAKGFIRPSTSDSSAPTFFVRDPPSEGRNEGQLRLVVDFRDLNQNIELDEYPIPLARTVMERLPKARIFTKFDVRSGFANIRVAPGSEPLTAFKTFFGLFEYQVMPMGLATAPSIFQRFINSVLNPYLERFCFAYLDDIIIFSDSEEEHREHVRLVLEALEKNDLHLKPKKCAWFKREVSFLGFTVVARKGIRMADDKIEALRSTPRPRHLTDLRSFLGTINFYDKFIPHYSDLTAPLTALTRKDVPWVWDERCETAFARLLEAIRNDVFLKAFDPTRQIRLETDASDVAYGGCISQQDDDGHWRPIIFFHHKFKDAEKNWDVADKELYAIVYAFDRYRHFLAQPRYPVQVFSDHRNLAKFMVSTDLLKSHDGRLGRWWQKLAEANFQIQYRAGEENVVADFLTRYGYDDSAALDAKVLLPASRFSTKALADLSTWFKTSALTPNIRATLEKSLASKNKNQNGSCGPGSTPSPETPPIIFPRPTPPQPTSADAKKLSVSTSLTRPSIMPQPKANSLPALTSLAPAQAARPLFAKFLKGYAAPACESFMPKPQHVRRPTERHGIGWNPSPAPRLL